MNMPTLGDYWAIDMPDDIPPLFAPRQRVSNGSALTVSSIRVCLGRQNGTESGPVHFEIWSDKTSGCPNGEPHCQEQQLGDDSDSFEVSALATMGSGTGACGSASNGEEVTITWTGNQPAPSANFWVAGVDDGVTGGEVRWGASAGDTYVDTNFDAWKGDVDRNNDFYFVVAGQ
ncbi:MAG: hypothetical protein IT293_20905 [Deltaproteobacteria bacterium]|nr:hypothetical protein [Deltaproteobacteria bacterium]